MSNVTTFGSAFFFGISDTYPITQKDQLIGLFRNQTNEASSWGRGEERNEC